MKKVQILAALLVFALLSGVAALHLKGGSGKKAMTEDMPSPGTNPQDSTPIETEKPEVPSCTLISNTSFELANAGGGATIFNATSGKSLFFMGLELTPEVHFLERKSYGKVFSRDWPKELGIRPPCAFTGEWEVFVSNRTATARFSYSIRGKLVLGQFRDFPAGKVYLAQYIIPIQNGSWKIIENIVTINESDFLKTGGMIPRMRRLTATCSCNLEEFAQAFQRSIEKAGFERVENWWEPQENEDFKPVMIGLYRGGDQYLYVEIAEVKGTGLLRVFMAMGNEEVTRAAAEIFSATFPKRTSLQHATSSQTRALSR